MIQLATKLHNSARRLRRCLITCLPLCILSGCAVFGIGYGTGSVNVKFDSTTGICEVELNYRGESYRQVFQDETLLQKYYARLSIAAVDTKYIEGHNGQDSYSVFGGCLIAEPVGNADQKIRRVQLEYLIPSSALTINRNDIVNGPTPKQLADKGFTIANPVKSSKLQSSLPENFADELVHSGFNFLHGSSQHASVAGIKFPGGICSAKQIIIRGGTLTVFPGNAGTPSHVSSDDKTLQRYAINVARWEFDGVVSGYAC